MILNPILSAEGFRKIRNTNVWEGDTINGPKCTHNGVPPRLLARVSHHGLPNVSTIQFEITGERPDGRWLNATVYSISDEEVAGIFPVVMKAASAIWTAFYETSE